MPPETNNTHNNTPATRPLPWYRSGIVWLGVFLTLLVIAGCIHLIVITRAYKIDTTEPVAAQTTPGELTHFRGMPLHSAAPTEATEPTEAGGKAAE